MWVLIIRNDKKVEREVKSLNIYKNRAWRLTCPPNVLDVGKGRFGSASRGSWQYPCWDTQESFSPVPFFCHKYSSISDMPDTVSALDTWPQEDRIMSNEYSCVWMTLTSYLLAPITNFYSQGNGLSAPFHVRYVPGSLHFHL